jgi:hypothetical protein
MLINPKRNIFRVCATADADAANKISTTALGLLGYTLASGAAGLVAYGPSQNAGPVSIDVAQPNASPDVAQATFTRYAGPIDVAIGEAISLVRADLAEFVVAEGTVEVGGSLLVWKAGTIGGEADIAINNTETLVGTGDPIPATDVALPAQAWVVEAP